MSAISLWEFTSYLELIVRQAVRLVTGHEGFAVLLVISVGYWYNSWLRRGPSRH